MNPNTMLRQLLSELAQPTPDREQVEALAVGLSEHISEGGDLPCVLNVGRLGEPSYKVPS